MNSKSEYDKLREEELLWLKNQSGIDQYKDCNSLDEVELVYKEIFPAFYGGSVRRWMGENEGVHKWTDGGSLRSLSIPLPPFFEMSWKCPHIFLGNLK